MKRILIPAAMVAAAVVPATADAAIVQTNLPCYPSGANPPVQVAFGGQQFTPGASWRISGDGVFASGTVDASGNALATSSVPFVSSSRRSPKTVQYSATDGVNTVPGSFQVISPGAKWDGSGNPRGTVKWSFGGLTPGKPIYVHVRRGSKTIKTTRVGKAKGACGTASKRLKRLPVNSSSVRNGNYRIFIDNKRKFSRGGVQYGYSYRVFTTFR